MNSKVFIVLAIVLTICFASPVDDDKSTQRERRQYGYGGFGGYGGGGGGVANSQSTAINNGPGGIANSNSNALNNPGGYGGYGYGK